MNMRLSRITEHNQDEETDHLYDPLRDTLRKSSVSNQKALPRSSSSHQLRGSNVSRVIRDLQPEQALQMQRNIFIPSDKKLRATDHIQKIQGKSFSAVDIRMKEGAPISEEEFIQRYYGANIQETLYEFSSNGDSKQSSPPLMLIGTQKKVNTGMQPNQNRFGSVEMIPNLQQRLHKGKVSSESRLNQMFRPGKPVSRGSSSKSNQGEGRRQFPHGYAYDEEELATYRKMDAALYDELKRRSSTKRSTNKSEQTVMPEAKYQAGRGDSSRYSRKPSQRDQGTTVMESNFDRFGRGQTQQESTTSSGSGRTSTSSTISSSRKRQRYGLAKSAYKYNLFSSLDEAVNTKCGSFGRHELVASKPKQSWEK